MGFFSGFLGKVLPAVGTAVGGYFGGPAGASLGGALGSGLSSGLQGGPSSVGGITGGAIPQRGSGAAGGVEAREYYDEAFPGTNPWERLGAGNPMGAVMSAGVAAKTAQRNVDKQASTSIANVNTQTQTQKANVAVQAATQLKGSQMAARASAAATAQNYPVAERSALMRDVEHGPDRPGATAPVGPGARQREARSGEIRAKAAEMDSWTRDKMAHLKGRELDIEAGHKFKDPASARLAAVATHAFDIGMSQTTFVAWMRDNPKKLAAMGVAVHTIGGAARVLSGVFGRVKVSRPRIPKKTSVGPKADPVRRKFGEDTPMYKK